MPRVIIILGIFVGTRHRDPRNITYTYYDGCMFLLPFVKFTIYSPLQPEEAVRVLRENVESVNWIIPIPIGKHKLFEGVINDRGPLVRFRIRSVLDHYSFKRHYSRFYGVIHPHPMGSRISITVRMHVITTAVWLVVWTGYILFLPLLLILLVSRDPLTFLIMSSILFLLAATAPMMLLNRRLRKESSWYIPPLSEIFGVTRETPDAEKQ